MRWDVRLDGALPRHPRARQRVRTFGVGRHPARRSARQAGGRARATADLHRRVRPGAREHARRARAQRPRLRRADLSLGSAAADRPRRGRRPHPRRRAAGLDDPHAGRRAGDRRESICGVLELSNRRSGGSYTPRDRELLRIFAAYMSSSIQNALDAIRARAQARIDDLTGLFNSRYFHTRLERRDRARRPRRLRPVHAVHRPRSSSRRSTTASATWRAAGRCKRSAQMLRRTRLRRGARRATAATSSSSSCRGRTWRARSRPPN